MNHSNIRVLLAASLALVAAATGCSRQAFVVGRNTSGQAAPGSYVIPPKVDILLVQDDTGSMIEAFNGVKRQMPSFLNQLESKGWDYRFATIPLTSLSRPVNQVAASRYDSNWGASWLPPYPWRPNDPSEPDPRLSTLAPQYFRSSAAYSGFLQPGEVKPSSALEPGFLAIADAFQNRLPQTFFLRDDAMLVMLIVANGNDTSLVNLCRRSDGWVGPCDDGSIRKPRCADLSQYDPAIDAAGCGTSDLSFSHFAQGFASLKPAPEQLKIYSAVGDYRYTGQGCLNGNASPGTRYTQMAQMFGGESYDICKQAISTVLTNLSAHLTAQRLEFRTRYLFIEEDPAPETIAVTVFRNGDPNQAELIPNDPVNGWTYRGYLSDVYAIDVPFDMNLSSGFAIELHGRAKLRGNDSADVSYKASGVSDSATPGR